jgi:hypothetical protein
MKGAQPFFARALRFFKRSLLPENLPGFDFEQHLNSFKDSYKMPVEYKKFVEDEAPRGMLRALELAQAG